MVLKLKTIRSIHSFSHKKVFLRTDFDVPLSEHGAIHDDWRIRRSLPTIQYLQKRGARILIGAHLGRPEGKVVEKLRLEKIAKTLSRLLRHRVRYQRRDIFSETVKEEVCALNDGDIFLFENLRFSPEEKENNKFFCRKLAAFADLYVNDAFASLHREHASIVGLPRLVPSFAGFALMDEALALSKVCERRAYPAVIVIGGKKIASKLNALALLLQRFDLVLLGGAVANTALVAQGHDVGQSLFERSVVSSLTPLVKKKNLLLPCDVLVSSNRQGKGKPRIVAVECIPKRTYVLDIGPKTIQRYKDILLEAKTVIMAGPLGYYEIPAFSSGTQGVVHAIAQGSAYSVVGGGDTLDAVRRFDAEQHFSYISSGGGALLHFISGKMLPGIRPLLRPLAQ